LPESRKLPPSAQHIQEAATHIQNGGIVAYPTETVYGLGVDPRNEDALEALFALKGRPPDRPALLLIHTRNDLHDLASSIPDAAYDLMDRFWPGPLTLLLPARSGLSPYITSGADTVAVRQASPGVAHDLVALTHGPITSTSANRTGAPPALSGTEAAQQFLEDNVLVLDGQCEPEALPSTLVDTTSTELVVIRTGTISESEILRKK